jgi:hypothetical protein
MTGQVLTYSGTSLTVNITKTGGSGTFADWTIKISGAQGEQGATGSISAVTDLTAASSAGINLKNLGGQTVLNLGAGGGLNGTFSGNLSMQNLYKVINHIDPTSAQDVATKNYVDTNKGFTLLGEVATTSGTAIDLTGLPSTATVVILNLEGVQAVGSTVTLQLIDSGGAETSGYISTGAGVTNASVISVTSYTNGFAIRRGATDSFHGSFIFTKKDDTNNTWCLNGIVSSDGVAAIAWSGGSKSLSGDLTGIRLTTQSGSDAFNGGSANLTYV